MTPPVVVVGAGPTGAAAAIALGQRGVECLVLDRWDDVYPQPRAVHLDDEVARLLAQLGVAEQFGAISRPGEGLRLVTPALHVLAELPRGGVSPVHGYPRASMFDQPDLERVLRERLGVLPSVQLCPGQEVTGVEQVRPGRVRVRHRDRATGVEHSIDAAVVLGCDGANSLVRDAIGARMHDLGFSQRWLVIDVDTPVDLGHWGGVHQVCDGRRAATYMQIGATRHRWEVQLREGETADRFATLEALAPLLAPWLDDVPLGRLTLLRSVEYTFRAAVADRWRSGRVLLLGDAAHLTPPFIGQGLGAGLRDAANLAWKLAGVLDGTLAEDALDSYEEERAPHARAMVRLAQAVGVVMTGGGRAGDVLRRAGVPLLLRAPGGLRRRASDSTTPALRGTTLVAGDRADRLAGSLCPDLLGDGTRYDAVVGPVWALVTTEPAAPSAVGDLTSRGVTVLDATSRPALAAWLRGGGAVAALVRPDGVVLASGRHVPSVVARATPLLAPLPAEVTA
ncbi:MAG: bifunctional 3-(3-hydroxy-phenyl)propionate/3-hydroxycinnamic acid hydroxylase [Nocardioides alkalitolerans]